MTPIYLRDLKESLQEELIRQWEKTGDEKCKKLLNAIRTGQDIEIGTFANYGDEKIAN